MSAPIASLLAEHDWFTPRGYAWPCCLCGAEFPDGEEAAYAHVAAVLAPLVEEAAQEAVAAALAPVEELAQRWAEEDDGPDGYGYAAGDGPDPEARTAALSDALRAGRHNAAQLTPPEPREERGNGR